MRIRGRQPSADGAASAASIQARSARRDWQGMARHGWAWRGPARQGKAGMAGRGMAGRGPAWLGKAGEARRGWAWHGKAGRGLARPVSESEAGSKIPVSSLKQIFEDLRGLQPVQKR